MGAVVVWAVLVLWMPGAVIGVQKPNIQNAGLVEIPADAKPTMVGIDPGQQVVGGARGRGGQMIEYRSMWQDEQYVLDAATKGIEGAPTDKVSWHHYEHLYGLYLAPLSRSGIPVKMLEIGLGCGKHEAAGSKMWANLFPPPSKVWEAEFDAKCVETWRKEGKLAHLAGVVTGDQADKAVVEGWVKETGGNFDIIVDDGGHTNMQIFNTFEVLFNQALKPGGLYFVEDLLVSRMPGYEDSRGEKVMVEVLKDWAEQLTSLKQPIFKHKIPRNIKSIHFGHSIAVIIKCEGKPKRGGLLDGKARCP